MQLTHSTEDKVFYVLKLRGEPIARATRAKGQWRTTDGNATTIDSIYAPTMRDLKAAVWATLPESQKQEPAPKPPRLTLKAAFRLTGTSHTGARIHLTEARKTWPELRGEALAAYLIRKHMEANARWPGVPGDQARRWLAANPDLGRYDADEEARRLATLYPNQSEEICL